MRERSKECNNPTPQHGGQYCSWSGAVAEMGECDLGPCSGSLFLIYTYCSFNTFNTAI